MFKWLTALKQNPTENICPNCKKTLEKIPKRKITCQFCKKEIYVRSKQNIFPSILLNKTDAMAVDWLKRLDDISITEKDYIEASNKNDKKFKSTDIVWGLLNRAILKKLRANDFQGLKILYFNMALCLNDEDKDFFKTLQQSQRMGLMDCKKDSVIKKVKL